VKRFVLAKMDQGLNVHLPLTKEEIIEFIVRFREITSYFNDEEECHSIPMN
jgi:hypothetical protein